MSTSLFPEMVTAQGPVINVASVPHRSVFRYPGGKTWLVPYIREWLRRKERRPGELVEPFAGGGIVGLTAVFEDLVERVTLVELDPDVAAVWKAITGGKAKQLMDRIGSFEMGHDTVKAVLEGKHRSVVDHAFATIIRNRVQRGGILAPGASLMKNGENGKGLSSRWYPETLRKRISAIHQIRERITFIEGDGMEVMLSRSKSKNSVFFIDPPYTVAGHRLYKYSEVDHVNLFRTASSLMGDFLMTYDNADSIRNLAHCFGFPSRGIPMKNTHHAIMSELLVGRELEWVDTFISQSS